MRVERVAIVALVCAWIAWPALAEDKPLAPWSIHTMVSEGRRTYEGERLRAALVYGETGGPDVTVELIKVEMGYPSASRVLYRARIDLLGDSPDPCPMAETYCATLENLRWSSGQLEYEIVAKNRTLKCRVSGIRARAPETACHEAQ